MFNPGAGVYHGLLDMLTTAAPELAMQLVEMRLRNTAEIEPACREIAAMRNAGLVVLPDPLTGAHRNAIVSAVAKHGIRAVYPFKYLHRLGAGILWRRVYRSVSTCSIVFGTPIEWRTPGGFTCAATDQVRAGHQSQDHQGPRSHHAACVARSRGRGDRVIPPYCTRTRQ